MKKTIESIRKKVNRYGKGLCKNELIPKVKIWLRKNDFDEINFINGRAYVTINGETYWPDDIAEHLNDVTVANELVDLGNAIGYETGFDVSATIKAK